MFPTVCIVVLIVRVVFLFNQFSPNKIIVFDKIFVYLIEDINFLSSKSKRYFTSDYFLESSGGLKIMVIFWTNVCAL